MEIRLREKIKGYGHPVLSEEELGRFRGLSGDARVIGFKRITTDLEKRMAEKVVEKSITMKGGSKITLIDTGEGPFKDHPDLVPVEPKKVVDVIEDLDGPSVLDLTDSKLVVKTPKDIPEWAGGYSKAQQVGKKGK